MHTISRIALLAVVALTLGAAPVSARSTGVKVSFLPRHAVEGTQTRIAVTVRPARVACTLSVRYRDGARQTGLKRVVAANGHASWSWTVPTTVQAGPALASIHCGRAGSLSHRLMIVGKLDAPKILVGKSGFSTRVVAGGATHLSYGVVLHDSSPNKDADHVVVQTNFVLADDHLLGTDSRTIATIGAGSDYAVGGSVSFPGAAPVVRLEFVVQVKGFVAHGLHLPTLANIHLVPSLFDPSWLGSVEGELQNTDATLALQMASLSAVVFDADGNVLGGGTGFTAGPLPPGAREFLKLMSGFDAIPMAKAATTLVSVSPSWTQPSG